MNQLLYASLLVIVAFSLGLFAYYAAFMDPYRTAWVRLLIAVASACVILVLSFGTYLAIDEYVFTRKEESP